MPEPINKKIIANFAIYTKVKSSRKIIDDNQIQINKKSNNNNFKSASSVVKTPILNDIEFMIEAHKNLVCTYGIKLMSKTISDPPFFRLDASGGSHHNRTQEIPLNKKQVLTPHFQSYDEYGNNIAYQTEELKNKNIVDELRRDINKGVELFCNEGIISTNSGFPPIVHRDPCLLFKTTNIDPNDGF